jgi:hypothetical protein
MSAPRGGGKFPLPRELVRSQSLRVQLRPGEHADLLTIAEGWSVPPATAAFAMVATFLADCRKNTLDLGSVGIKMAAASLLLTAQGLETKKQTRREA